MFVPKQNILRKINASSIVSMSVKQKECCRNGKVIELLSNGCLFFSFVCLTNLLSMLDMKHDLQRQTIQPNESIVKKSSTWFKLATWMNIDGKILIIMEMLTVKRHRVFVLMHSAFGSGPHGSLVSIVSPAWPHSSLSLA